MSNNLLKFLRFTAVPSIAILVLLAGCSAPKQPQATSLSPTPTRSVAKEPAPSPITSQTPLPSPQTDPFQDASDKAIGAATVSQSALSRDDWDLVFGMWQEAINLMKAVPKSSLNYALAQKKVKEYQLNLVNAKQQAVKPAPSPDLTAARQQPLVSFAAAAPQLNEVTAEQFMKIYFEDTVDKGNDGTGYWCVKHEILASSLYSPRSWKILNTFVFPKKDMASIKTRIESSNKGGSPVITNWEFYLEKGDTLLQKQIRESGSIETYNYSKAKVGGWCIANMSK